MVLISVTGGRFPRALPQPPRRASSPSAIAGYAIPDGVAAFHYNQITEMNNKFIGNTQ